jgi:hypothetical protein
MRKTLIGWFMIAGSIALGAGPVRAEAEKSLQIPAPANQYLMLNRADEIALARSAAPSAISRDADVLVLGAHGYETAVKGKNGFTCLVERSWMLTYDDPEFLDPKVRLPLCLNAAATHTHLPFTVKATELALARMPKAKMFRVLSAAFRDKQLPLPELGSMCYMMSKQQYFGPKYKNADPHMMFWFAQADKVDWGGNQHGVPVYVTQDAPDPITTLVIPALTWSDGSPNLVDGH